MHVFMYEVLRNNVMYQLDSGENIFHRNSFVRDLFAATAASMLLHPLHYAEARFVLQNRLPHFQSYKSVFSLVMGSIQDTGAASGLLRGISVHMPRNFVLALTGYNYFTSVNIYTYVAQCLAFHTLAYPLLTIRRRLEC